MNFIQLYYQLLDLPFPKSAMSSGKIQTVLGLIDPSALGRTLTHEHITMDNKKSLRKPRRESDESKVYSGEPTLSLLGWIRQNPYCHLYNLSLGDEPLGEIVKEVEMFKKEGGSSIVDATTIGLERNVERLAKVSSASGVNIIAGAGYYLGHTLPPEVKSASEEELCKVRRLYTQFILTVRPLKFIRGVCP